MAAGRQRREETRPDWGSWSATRAVAWTAIAVVVFAVAGFATGGALSGGPTDAAVPFTTQLDAHTADGPAAWPEYDAVVVRNDDIQPYYRIDEMRAVDQVFVDEHVPVTLGVVPQVDEDHATTDTDLCAYLRANNRDYPTLLEYSFHGYTHEQRTTFVPPVNTYDEATVDALRAANYSVVSGGFWFAEAYYGAPGVFTHGGLTGNAVGTKQQADRVSRRGGVSVESRYPHRERHPALRPPDATLSSVARSREYHPAQHRENRTLKCARTAPFSSKSDSVARLGNAHSVCHSFTAEDGRIPTV